MTDWPKILDRSIAEYRQALKLANNGDQHNPGPWPVAKDVPLDVLKVWIGQVHGAWKLAYDECSRQVLLYGDPSPPHARTAGWFMKEVATQMKDVMGPDALKAVAFSTETIKLRSGNYKTPDFAVIADRCEDARSQAVMVLEVGYHCEQTFQTVKGEVSSWSQAMHPVVIGVKITDNSRASSIHSPCIEVIAKILGENDQLFHLGQGSSQPCLGLGTHVLEIPARFFPSVPHAPQQDVTSALHFDLYTLQEDIKRWVLLRDTPF